MSRCGASTVFSAFRWLERWRHDVETIRADAVNAPAEEFKDLRRIIRRPAIEPIAEVLHFADKFGRHAAPVRVEGNALHFFEHVAPIVRNFVREEAAGNIRGSFERAAQRLTLEGAKERARGRDIFLLVAVFHDDVRIELLRELAHDAACFEFCTVSGLNFNIHPNLVGAAPADDLLEPFRPVVDLFTATELSDLEDGFGYLLDSTLNIVGQVFTLAGVAAIIATLDVRVVLIFFVLTGVGTLAEGRAKEQAAKLTEQISADQRGWMYYARLFENFDYGKEIRLNAMGDWLLKRERAFFTRVNDNQKQQNDGYIRSGLIGSGCTFLQQCIAYAWLILRTMQGRISVGSFTMYVSAVTTFASALRTVLDNLTEIRVYDRFYDRLDEYLSVPARLRGDGDGRNEDASAGEERKKRIRKHCNI